MENTVVSKITGKEYEVKLILLNNGKGANHSRVIINEEEVHADWFLGNDGVLSCLCSFDMGELKGKMGKISEELEEWIDMKIENKKIQKERTANYRLGQEFGY